jgi:putative MATE family efflux protein
MANADENTFEEQYQYHRLDLREEILNRTIWSLALPAIGENLMYTLVFLSDTLIVGWLRDENALAATALSGLIMFFVNSPFYALSSATSSVVARSWGEHDFVGARKYAGHSIFMAFISAGCLLFVLFPIAHILIGLLGGSEEVVEMGGRYLRVVLFSAVFGLPLIVSNGIIRAKGDTRRPMLITAGMNVINVVVSAVLAFGVGPFPRMGMLGVATGTVAARTIGGIVSLGVLVSRKKGIGLGVGDILRFEGKAFGRIWHLAYPVVLDRTLHSLSSLVFIRIVAMLGTTALAAHNIALHVESVAFMPAVGVGAAVAAIVGQSIGARVSHIAELTVKRTLMCFGAFMVGLGVVFVLFAPLFVYAFGATPAVLNLAGIALQISALELPFLAFSIILSSSLRGAGDTRSPLYVTVVCIFIFRLGGVYLLAIVFGWGLPGVWLATSLDWACRSFGLWLFFRRGVWKLIHEREKAKYS